MDSNTNSTVIEIEDDVIDLDGSEKTPEDEIYEWDAKVRKSLSICSLAENELVLGNLMKQYFQSFEEMIMHFDGHESLRLKAFCHLTFLYSYFNELQCCNSDNYLTYMEDILTLYCNLEFEVVRRFNSPRLSTNKIVLAAARRIIYVLTVYLFEKRENILHVLIKMSVSNEVPACGEIVNHVFKHFLCAYTESTRDNDEAFCRLYILYQKWKQFLNKDQWKAMDAFLYKTSHRGPEDLERNETLRKILVPSSDETVGVVLNMFRLQSDLSKAYFKHISSKKNVDIDDLDLNIDLGEDEPTFTLDDEDEEEVKFAKDLLEFEQQMLTVKSSAPSPPEVSLLSLKQEVDNEDDVVFVSVTMVNQPEESISLTDVESPEARSPAEVTPPALPETVSEKETVNVSNLNGISKICISSVATISEPESNHSVQEEPLASSTPLSPSQPVDTSCVEDEMRLLDDAMQVFEEEIEVEMREEEEMPCLQAEDVKAIEEEAVDEEEREQTYVYNDFGLTTPPFDVAAAEEQHRKCVYTSIGPQSSEKESVSTDVYIDYGLTPPTDVPVEDSRLDEDFNNGGGGGGVAAVSKECECDGVTDMELEETTTTRVECEEVVVGEAQEQIDTGQKSVPDTAPNILQEVEVAPPPPQEIVNNNLVVDRENGAAAAGTVLKPLLASNHRSNGQKETPPSPQKIMYSLSRKITASLEDFSRFEQNWNHFKENKEFDDILSGPVVGKLSVPAALSPVKALTGESRADSPGDITSPVYEAMREDDFRDFYSDSVKARVPQSILKKSGSSSSSNGGEKVRKRNVVIDETNSLFEFNSDVIEEEEEEEEQHHAVKEKSIEELFPAGLRGDSKLKLRPAVIVERLSMIENEMRKVLIRPSTRLRIDYDKSTQHINAKDVMRCISPPKISLKVKSSSNSNKSGSSIVTTLSTMNETFRREKRKYEVPAAPAKVVQEPVTKKKRVFRSPKKKAFVGRKVREEKVEEEEEEEEEPVQKQQPKKRQRNSKKLVNNSTSGKTNNLLTSNSDSEFDKLLKSEGYTHQPFRVDLTS